MTTGPLRVEVRRGSFVESVHRVHFVAVSDGATVESAGDPQLTCSLRSSAKPFQALPLVRARPDIDDTDLAIASASHNAEPEQLAAVERLLEKAPASEHQLACGHDARNGGGGVRHNCSGKHAGMLATCHARGWQADGYHLAGHPLQLELHELVAAAAELAPDDVQTGVDGCGVVCFAVTLERAARMFSRLEQLDGGARVAAAMRARPELVGGAGADDTALMRAVPGTTAKRGAEALLCGVTGGVGFALKVEDGGYRAIRPALAELFSRLGRRLESFESVPVRNSRNEVVGQVRAE